MGESFEIEDEKSSGIEDNESAGFEDELGDEALGEELDAKSEAEDLHAGKAGQFALIQR